MGQDWVETETSGCDLGDVRLNRRLGIMLSAIGERPDKSLPTAFQDWSNTKAAYRFFANENVSEDKILEGHFAASALRIQATEGPILILQDTTEFSFKRSVTWRKSVPLGKYCLIGRGAGGGDQALSGACHPRAVP